MESKTLTDQQSYDKISALRGKRCDFKIASMGVYYWCDFNDDTRGVFWDSFTHVVTVWGVKEESMWIWNNGTFQESYPQYYDEWCKWVETRMDKEIEDMLTEDKV